MLMLMLESCSHVHPACVGPSWENCFQAQDSCSVLYLGTRLRTEGRRPSKHSFLPLAGRFSLFPGTESSRLKTAKPNLKLAKPASRGLGSA
jgi:hypothetical protein